MHPDIMHVVPNKKQHKKISEAGQGSRLVASRAELSQVNTLATNKDMQMCKALKKKDRIYKKKKKRKLIEEEEEYKGIYIKQVAKIQTTPTIIKVSIREH